MLEGERSYQRGQENLVPSNNASSAPESPVIPKNQENPWYIRHFIKLLIGFGLGGGAIALVLPWMLWLHCGMSSGSSDQLRLHLLYVTGGIIAVLTLLQTNWKNQGDRLKIDADIKKNEQDAEKNERDHIRQVHAERRSRYTKAVEQLADEKATVRLGGIYTLVGLVDEWLADENFKEESDRHKEGQVIVNSLCSYIRSPFPLAEKIDEYEARTELKGLESKKPGTLFPDELPRLDTLRKRFEDSAEYQEPDDIAALQAAFHEEQDVRRTIFVEMSKRSSSLIKNEKGDLIKIIPGTWSDFDFDFSRASIFYPLNDLTIEIGNFSSAKFYGEANFYKTVFTTNADFSEASFTGNANFVGATFIGDAFFSEATFIGNASLGQVTFVGDVSFYLATFTSSTAFSKAVFIGNTDFIEATFTDESYFYWATFNSDSDFSRATFINNAYFNWATFTSKADFTGTTFTNDVDFVGAIFENFEPTFYTRMGRAKFSVEADPQEYIFLVAPGSKPIILGSIMFRDKSYSIPRGAVLFDPNSWDEENYEYTRISEPAK